MTKYREQRRTDTIFVSVLTIFLVGVSAFILGFALSQADVISIGKSGESETGDTGPIYKVVDESSREMKEVDFDQYWEIWDKVQDEYIDESAATDGAMFYGSVKGMVDGLGDPHSAYFSPEDYDLYQEMSEGGYEGVGMYLGYEDGFVIVEQPMEGSPAEAAGLKSGDIILEVDGESVEDKSVEEVVLLIRGETGTSVKIKVYTSGDSDPREVEVQRTQISVPAISWEDKGDGIVLIDLSRFTDASLYAFNAEWDKIAEEVEAANPRVIIVDMRPNGGGYLEGATYVAQDFLAEGKIITTHVTPRHDLEKKYTVTREGKFVDTDVIILVGEYTASAAEIFSGALQKNDRAIVIGERTVGKGTAQSIFEFDDGSALKLTVANWTLPDGTVLSEENPIVPDIELEFDDEAWKNGTDNVMDAAIQKAKEL